EAKRKSGPTCKVGPLRPPLVAAATAARPARVALVLGLVHPDRAPVDLAPVERVDHGGDIGHVELDEAEPARSTGVAIGDHARALDLAVFTEELFELSVVDVPGKGANKELGMHQD